MTSGSFGGKTPLTEALRLSKDRVKRGDHYPFMVVVSDGMPNNKDEYLSELSQTSFPVIGINITSDGQADRQFSECYDVCRGARPANLSQTLSTVARDVIF
jgi:hypothetical protein